MLTLSFSKRSMAGFIIGYIDINADYRFNQVDEIYDYDTDTREFVLREP